MRAVCLLRLIAGQCDANGLSKQNQEETNVTNYTVDLAHFSHFFFHPKMCYVHADMRAFLFEEGGGTIWKHPLMVQSRDRRRCVRT